MSLTSLWPCLKTNFKATDLAVDYYSLNVKPFHPAGKNAEHSAGELAKLTVPLLWMWHMQVCTLLVIYISDCSLLCHFCIRSLKHVKSESYA